jgi:hypothetical protein
MRPFRYRLSVAPFEAWLVAHVGSGWFRRYAEEKNPGVAFRAME